MNIVYVANVRIPTYRAHGIQITKMCEEFARLGNTETLVVPAKRHTISGTNDLFEVYGLERIFTCRHIPSLDLLSSTHRFGRIYFRTDFVSFLSGLWNMRKEIRDSVIYVRDPLLALPFWGRGNTIVAEVHEIPRRKRLYVHLLKLAHYIVVLTNPGKQDLISEGVVEDRIIVAADGVDVSQFTPTETKSEARARLELPLNHRIVMYMGRLDGWKGVDTLLEASPLLEVGTKLVIIGGEVREVQELSKRYPHVHFLGNRPYIELKNNQIAADVLILPNTAKHITSARHTSPLKLFSYMVSGVPIVASDLPSLRDIIDESSAEIVTADDVHALAKGIHNTFKHPERGVARARVALERVHAYTWEKRAKKILQRIVE